MLRNKYVAASVGILLLFVVAYNLRFFSTRSNSPQISLAVTAESNEQPPASSIKVPERITEQKDTRRWKRDPFALKVQLVKIEGSYMEDLHLFGILKRNGRSYALINGKVYSVNDWIGDAVIKDIKKHSIVFYSDGKINELSIDDYTVVEEKIQ